MDSIEKKLAEIQKKFAAAGIKLIIEHDGEPISIIPHGSGKSLPPLTKKSTEVERIIWETDQDDDADGGISMIGGVRIPPHQAADESKDTPKT